jgi:pimeloyl-ACP methyl ester carboxylesterase
MSACIPLLPDVDHALGNTGVDDCTLLGERLDEPATPRRHARVGRSVPSWTVTPTRSEGRRSAGQATVIVGHSIGSQIAELVAAKRPDTVGLVLIASVPLAGTHYPAEALEPFSQAAGSVEAMRALVEGASAGSAWRGSTNWRQSAPRSGPTRSRRSRRRGTTAIPMAARPASTGGPSCCCRAQRTPVASIDSVKDQVAPRFAEARYFCDRECGPLAPRTSAGTGRRGEGHRRLRSCRAPRAIDHRCVLQGVSPGGGAQATETQPVRCPYLSARHPTETSSRTRNHA